MTEKTVPMKYRRMEFNAQLQTENDRLRAQRDALLEALKLMLEQFTKTPSTLKDSEARIKAHAAIKQAEGEST